MLHAGRIALDLAVGALSRVAEAAASNSLVEDWAWAEAKRPAAVTNAVEKRMLRFRGCQKGAVYGEWTLRYQQ